ncbi:hypothetical protein H8B09_19130 [Paenibacillus sp. PR3]|uniref:Carrier domain-containing protein n=1 Tax=Paenibacillus terricola TaxID=2763503 RepID=A0ABR8MY63_9BACL|nr:condensation domain-containing protein [Paenibacillus terricola]MBD3920888.1 hypothetical protein [Paenibacillus terricola]
MLTTANVTVHEQRVINGSLLSQTAYNIPLFVRFGQGLNIRKMYNLLTERFERLAIFRTSFQMEGVMTKRVSKEAPLIEIQTFPRMDKLEKEELLASHLIGIEDEELVRTVLCKISGETADYLFLNVHHALMDGFSMNLFLQDLLASYLRDEPCSLESTLPTNKEASITQMDVMDPQRFESYDSFKTKLLGKQTDAVHYLCESFVLPDWPRRHSDFALTLSAFALSMAQWLGTYEVYTAYPSLGRDMNTYRQLGNFVQMIPFDLQLDPEQSVESLIGAVQKRTIANLGSRDYYGEVMRLERMQLLNLFRDIVFDYKSGTLIDKLLDGEHDITLEDAEAYRDEKYGMHFSVYKNGQLLQLTVIASEYAEDELRQLIALFRANVDALYRHTQASVGSMVGIAKLASATEPSRADGQAIPAAQFAATAAELQTAAAVEEAPAQDKSTAPPDAAEQPMLAPSPPCVVTREQREAAISRDIMSIVSAMLDGETVKPNESFFDIGMDSTLLVKFKKRVRDQFGVNLKISDFFNQYTSELLSAHIMKQLKEDY